MTPTRADIYYSSGARAGVEDCVARMRAKALEYVGTDAARVLLAFADDLEAGLVEWEPIQATDIEAEHVDGMPMDD
jgi:hypothetical protein